MIGVFHLKNLGMVEREYNYFMTERGKLSGSATIITGCIN